MRVVQIIAGLDNDAAGTTTWLRRLVQELAGRQLDVAVLTISAAQQPSLDVVGLTTFRPDAGIFPGFRMLLGSRMMRNAIAAAGRSGHVLHSSGLWRLPNVYPGWVAAETGCPLIVSPHGMLAPGALEYSARKKRLFSTIIQRRALDSATCWHATSLKEVEDIRAFGLTAPIALIPSGIDVPDDMPAQGTARSAGNGKQESRRRIALYLGRIHPIKGLDRLLDAWARVELRHPDWDLRIVGPSQVGHGDALRAQAQRLGVKQVHFHDGLYGDDKARAYRDADVLVLPTLGENFGMVVAESLANGTPVICTKGAPWEGLVAHDCGWWIDHGVDPLVMTLSEAMALPRMVLKRMGDRGRDWMARDFSWARVAVDMEMLYRWCTTKGEPPPFVHFA